MYYNRKGISQIVGISLLLLLLALLIFISIQWFQNYSSETLADSEKQSQEVLNQKLLVDNLIGNNLIIKNNLRDNLNLSKITIDGVDCALSSPLSLGSNTLDVSACVGGLTTQTPSVVLVYDDKTVKKRVYHINNTLSMANCLLDGVLRVHGGSAIFFNSSSAPCHNITRTCNDGTYDGDSSFNLKTCTIVTADTLPDAFSFINQSGAGVPLSTIIFSNIITPTGYDGPLFVNISGDGSPQLQVNGGSWVTSTNMNPGDTLRIRLNSSNSYLTTSIATLQLGDYKTNWSVTTRNVNVSDFFISVWNTSLSGVSNSTSIQLPLDSSGTYNFTAYWGDGTSSQITSWNDPDVLHTYGSPGVYEVNLSGDIDGFAFNAGVGPWIDDADDGDKLLDIKQWGNLRLADGGEQFSNAENFNITATDAPNLTGITDMASMFRLATTFNGDLSNWDVSSVTDMNFMFYNGHTFNQDLSSWDVSSVTDMGSMFYNAFIFNQPLDNWNVSSVNNMNSMFYNAQTFNQNLNNWDVSGVTDMGSMFYNANVFNGNINSWNTSSLVSMNNIFHGATSFNQNINTWDVSGVSDMSGVFNGANSFNQPLDSWDVSNIVNMSNMFNNSDSFNQDLSSWDVSSVTDMNGMFSWNDGFNNSINSWNTSSIIDMDEMFRNATSFNQDMRCLNVTNIGIEPTDFATGSPLDSNGMKPVWGTDGSACGINPLDFFISMWNTSQSGVSTNTQIQLPLDSSGTYNFTAYWGDGTSSQITAWNDPDALHTYATAGVYEINLSGQIDGFAFNAGAYWADDLDDGDKLLDIKQWGNLRLANTGEQFSGAENFIITATDAPNLTGITNMSYMFIYADSFTGDLSSWNVSDVTSMKAMFYETFVFNSDLSSWDVSSVTDMGYMFRGASIFNSDLNGWDVSNVTDMRSMFYGTNAFNSDLNSWNVSKVTHMNHMFRYAIVFNGNISSWDVSSVTNMYVMFGGADSFNGDLSSWDVSNVINMSNMFYYAVAFNGNLSSWNVSSVTDMYAMFYEADSFNGDLSSWDVSSVTDMWSMFYEADVFNGDISSWDVSNVVNMQQMFFNAQNFNSNLSSWDVSSVTNMSLMFYENDVFNSDLSSWDVSGVTSMRGMFWGADVFNSDLSSWDVSSVTNMYAMFYTAFAFDQDLRCWNVTNIGSEPSSFASSSPLDSNGMKPVWGTDGSACGLSFGILVPNLITPATNITISTENFTIISNIQCIGGTCGDVNLSLELGGGSNSLPPLMINEHDEGNPDMIEIIATMDGINPNGYYIELDEDCNGVDMTWNFVDSSIGIMNVGDVYAESESSGYFSDPSNQGAPHELVLKNSSGDIIDTFSKGCSVHGSFIVPDAGLGVDQSYYRNFDGDSNSASDWSYEASSSSTFGTLNSGQVGMFYSFRKVSMNSGYPFYTTTQNPMNPVTDSCLSSMTDGDSCNITWNVYSNTSSGNYEFFTIANSMSYPANISEVNSSSVWINISNSVDPFSFINQTNVSTDTLIYSNIITPTGYYGSFDVSVSGDGSPQISVAGGAWTTSTTISPGQNLQVRLTSDIYGTTLSSSTITLGSYSTNWTVETMLVPSLSCSTDNDIDGYFNHICANYPMTNTVYEGDLDPFNDTSSTVVPDLSCIWRDDKNQCEENFIVNGCGTGTVLDTASGLCWQRDMNAGGLRTWASAHTYCDGLVLGGHSDWYLPSRLELFTIVDHSRSFSTVVGGNNNIFVDLVNDDYWTASEYGPSTGNALEIYFPSGADSTGLKTGSNYLVCVRRD